MSKSTSKLGEMRSRVVRFVAAAPSAFLAGDFVVFDRTSEGVFHGHVRPWNELTPQKQNTLRRSGMADRRGRILVGSP